MEAEHEAEFRLVVDARVEPVRHDDVVAVRGHSDPTKTLLDLVKAGLQKGDVIVEIAGQSITNIYDYTFALELLKIGQPAKVVYMRGTEKKETTLTPAARK